MGQSIDYIQPGDLVVKLGEMSIKYTPEQKARVIMINQSGRDIKTGS
jgi:hypothetical protein